MKVRALTVFEDLQEHTDRRPGDIFEVTKERFEQINSKYDHALVEAIEEPKEPEVEKRELEPKQQSKRTTSRLGKH